VDKHHFTKFAAENSAVSATRADEKVVKMMNTMNYIGIGESVMELKA
jgi:hypothetical protein